MSEENEREKEEEKKTITRGDPTTIIFAFFLYRKCNSECSASVRLRQTGSYRMLLLPTINMVSTTGVHNPHKTRQQAYLPRVQFVVIVVVTTNDI